jgi:hypothetical protein
VVSCETCRLQLRPIWGDNPQVLRLRPSDPQRKDGYEGKIDFRGYKEPHPTIARGAGPLHQPRFPDALQERRKKGGGA